MRMPQKIISGLAVILVGLGLIVEEFLPFPGLAIIVAGIGFIFCGFPSFSEGLSDGN